MDMVRAQPLPATPARSTAICAPLMDDMDRTAISIAEIYEYVLHYSEWHVAKKIRHLVPRSVLTPESSP